jgi:dephospho-CoA kinase
MVKCHVLLLGGIGVGKTQVGRALQASGFEVITADEVGHQVLGEPEVVSQIRRWWPESIRCGAVDRSILGEIVFENPDELVRLEAITHPRIREALAYQVSSVVDGSVVVEMPLLNDFLEGEWIRIVIDAPDEVRLRRLIARGLYEVDAQARMSAQPSRADYLAVADITVDNSGTVEDLERRVAILAGQLKRMCAERFSHRARRRSPGGPTPT